MDKEEPMTFVEHVMCDAILMALYIHGYERPAFMGEHIEHCQRTFGVQFERWDGPAQEVLLPQEQFAKVRLAERERCARIAEAYRVECGTYADAIAQVIREG